MKILAIADVESKYLWDYFEKSKLEGSILSYHVGILIPAIFLFWRHLHQRLFYMSMETMTINMKRIPPEGCICIDDKIYVHEGVRILGLGGFHAI